MLKTMASKNEDSFCCPLDGSAQLRALSLQAILSPPSENNLGWTISNILRKPVK